MKAAVWASLVFSMLLGMAVESRGQAPVGALAIDERQGDQWGWAVDYETAAAAQERALGECGPTCSVVLTFGRCAAYAADQDPDSTAVGWAEAYASGTDAQQAALAECRSRDGASCIVRAWGCNSAVVEEGLNLDRAARRRIQHGLRAAGFDPGVADGLFGPRTRAAIRAWQSAGGRRATGYLDESVAAALRSAGGSEPAVAATRPSAPPEVTAPQQPSSAVAEATAPTAAAELEGLFWQSVMDSTDPAEFEAYLRRFPNGVFTELAQARLAALRASANGPPPGIAGTRVGGPSEATLSGAAGRDAVASDVIPRPGDALRDCDVCPEMVVMPGGEVALGRYEVTLGEFRAFAAAGGAAPGRGSCEIYGRSGSWRNAVYFDQTDLHPVMCVNWHDAQAYLSWLSQMAGVKYRLPTAAEWDMAAVGSRPGCGGRYQRMVDHREGTCRVGAYGFNGAGLADMVGNVVEWVEDCYDADCRTRRTRSVDFALAPEYQRYDRGGRFEATHRTPFVGFRVARTIE